MSPIMLLCSVSLLVLFLLYWHFNSLIALALLHIAVIGWLYNGQDYLLYYPEMPEMCRTFVEMPTVPHENIYYNTRDGVTINMVLMKQSPELFSKAPTVIFFHGNAGNIGHRLMNANGLYEMCKVNILLVEYRGYGKSSGHPSEHGLYLDGEAAMAYLLDRRDIDHSKLIVFGRSLGGAVAIHLASLASYSKHIACLMVENTFTSIPDMAKIIFNIGLLNYLPEYCYKNKFMSELFIQKVSAPTLFLSGLQDTLVPNHMMSQLHSKSGSRLKRFRTFAEGTHNETWLCAGYYDVINHFLKEVLTLQFSTEETVSDN